MKHRCSNFLLTCKCSNCEQLLCSWDARTSIRWLKYLFFCNGSVKQYLQPLKILPTHSSYFPICRRQVCPTNRPDVLATVADVLCRFVGKIYRQQISSINSISVAETYHMQEFVCKFPVTILTCCMHDLFINILVPLASSLIKSWRFQFWQTILSFTYCIRNHLLL